MNILIADDEKAMLRILKDYFIREGYKVFLAEDGEKAMDIFYEHKISLAVLDWMMPKMSGIKVCREIKKISDAKVLILTAKSENDDELLALKSGCDDYVKKPFDPRILLLRAKKLLKTEGCVWLGDLMMDTTSRKIFRRDQNINATKKEYELFLYFYRQRGRIVNRKQILDNVWGVDYFGDGRTVDTHIWRLREKIGDDWIKTHRGIGYCMENIE